MVIVMTPADMGWWFSRVRELKDETPGRTHHARHEERSWAAALG